MPRPIQWYQNRPSGQKWILKILTLITLVVAIYYATAWFATSRSDQERAVVRKPLTEEVSPASILTMPSFMTMETCLLSAGEMFCSTNRNVIFVEKNMITPVGVGTAKLCAENESMMRSLTFVASGKQKYAMTSVPDEKNLRCDFVFVALK